MLGLVSSSIQAKSDFYNWVMKGISLPLFSYFLVLSVLLCRLSAAGARKTTCKKICIYRYITVHLGSVRLLVNTQTGAIAERIDYDEFGRVLHEMASYLQQFLVCAYQQYACPGIGFIMEWIYSIFRGVQEVMKIAESGCLKCSLSH